MSDEAVEQGDEADEGSRRKRWSFAADLGVGRNHRVNKQRERATVEAFVASRSLPISCILDCDRERPDALIDVNGGLVGLEVTTVIEESPRYSIRPQKWTAEAVRIVARAQQGFERDHHRALIVRLELRPEWHPGDIAASVLAAELAQCVARAVTEPPLFVRPGEPITLRDPRPALSWLYAAPAVHSPEGYWAPSFAGDVYSASAADVRATVSKKEAELAIYRLAAPQAWLLVDCDLSGQGFALDVPEPFIITTSFDRVFCCGFGMWQWVEIPIHDEAVSAAARAAQQRDAADKRRL